MFLCNFSRDRGNFIEAKEWGKPGSEWVGTFSYSWGPAALGQRALNPHTGYVLEELQGYSIVKYYLPFIRNKSSSLNVGNNK